MDTHFRPAEYKQRFLSHMRAKGVDEETITGLYGDYTMKDWRGMMKDSWGPEEDADEELSCWSE